MALVLPLLLVLLFGSVELGNSFYSEHVLIKGVRDGARYAARQAFSNYTACSGSPGATIEDNTKTLVRTGQISGGSDILPNWTNAATTFSVTTPPATWADYLDAVRQCYGDKAVVITETGAEANRDGPVEERGTYQYQQDFANFHFGVYATKPWLSGAIWWGLEEFRVRPGWQGGNPRPHPPIHEKGLLTFDGQQKKPAWFDVNRIFTTTKQLG